MKKDSIEEEFTKSWDEVENNYLQFQLDNTDAILALIKKMRNRGFDRIFRAGTSLYTLVLSRSLQHGLRMEQKRILFEFIFIYGRVMDVTGVNGAKFSFGKVEYNESIENMLLELQKEEID